MGVPWTPEEDAIVREIWASDQTTKALAHRLPNRSVNAIRQRMTDLKLSRRGGAARSHFRWLEGLIVAELGKGRPLTPHQLAELTGGSLARVRELLRMGHGVKFFIAGWSRVSDRGCLLPKWALGAEDDEAKPPRMTKRAANAKYQAALRARRDGDNPFHVAMAQVSQKAA
ncbi:SANT/Myb-like DNA-binding domain-containing protein [Burkholderia sp. JKS000303]|uniref:SANT/Myb-like DNA-binding domain-containing protein n=1 Tax=Burkholderia sp. JKS000303 TaxID=1938747 RepID=UPI000BF7F49C|nr:SANT/Myb-like DNA-binding domain-containing protein [Burkholderia sp. JKS000303]PFH29116.1 hypothetical protein BX604_2888 [Burkholderia sp. JKS000303]